MSVIFNDLQREYKEVRREIENAIHEVLASAHYILGPRLDAFEKEFAKFCGARYAVGVGSGTEALHLALVAAGVGPGCQVITATNTCGPTVSAIMAAGAEPVFADADAVSYTIDPGAVERKITKKTKAILPVHIYGQSCEMDRLLAIGKKYKIPVVEDCAHAHGAKYKRKNCGTLGLAGCFSFYPTKNMGAYGDAGIITTNSKKMDEACRLLRNYGQKDRYTHEIPGFNSRLDELHAAVLSVKLKKLDAWNKRRRDIAQKYDSGIKNPMVNLPKVCEDAFAVYHLYVVRSEKRDALRSHLDRRGVQTLIHYPVPMHRQPFYRRAYGRRTGFPVAERLCKEIVSLPLNPFLTDKEADAVIKAVNSFTG